MSKYAYTLLMLLSRVLLIFVILLDNDFQQKLLTNNATKAAKISFMLSVICRHSTRSEIF